MKTKFTRVTRLSLTSILALGVLAGIFSLAASVAVAQSFRGSIRGVVTDPLGAVVPDAKVAAKNLATGEIRETTTGEDGGYVIAELPAGEYELAIDKSGFARHPVRALVSTGVDTNVDYKLDLLGQKYGAQVNDVAPLVETSNTTLSQVVDRRLVEELPLNGRDFGKLVALTPGVTVEGSGVAGSEKGFGQFNINGNRDRSNNYTLDGTDNNDPFFNNSALNQVGITGAPATLLPLDAIQEFNLQSQFGAEYGRNSGSVVNIITRSGTNMFHGSLYEYNRNSYFDARNYFNPVGNPQTAFNNNNFGGSVGGPVIKERTFFFGAYEGQRERVGSDFSLIVPTAADFAAAQQVALKQTFMPITRINPALTKILGFFPSSTTNTLPSAVRDKNDGDNLIVKIDHKLWNSNTLTGRYAFGQSTQLFPLGSIGGFGSGSRIGTFAQTSPTRVQVISTSLLTTLSATKVNELRFGYSRFRTSFTSVDGKFDPSTLGINFGTNKLGLPEFDFGGAIDNLGATGFSIPRARVSETFQLLDNFTWIHGRHTIKFGGEYHRYDVQSFNDNLERGLFSVNSTVTDPSTGNSVTLDLNPIVNILANFYIGNVFVSANAGDTHRFTFNNGLSFFGQDEIRLHQNFTLNLGLRWEYFGPLGEKQNLLSNFDAAGNLVQVGSPTLPHLYSRDLNNFGPHAGFAWNLRRKTVVRAAYGIYYDYFPQNNLIANFTTSAGVATNPTGGPGSVLQLNPFSSDFNVAAFTGSATAPVLTFATPPFTIFITDYDLHTPYVQSWNLNIQQQVGGMLAFEVGYVGSKGTKLSRLYDANQGRTNTKYQAIDLFSSGANSTYHALQSTVRLQSWHRLAGFSTYTWSKSLDGASDGINFNFANAAFPQDSTNLRAEKGPSTYDTRHRWTSAINYQVPVIEWLPKLIGDGWQLNTVVTIQSGRPISILTPNGGVNFNFLQRPDIVPGVNPILSNWTPSTGYLNALAFKEPAGDFGNLGRDQIFGPGFSNEDFSISKMFQLRERLALQFRTEFFNTFNHPNFALPGNVFTPAIDSAGKAKPLLPGCTTLQQCYPAGVITQTPDVAQGNPGLGGGGPRVIQFGLRLQF
ncbi:MAG TPA: carboxypeptidase regulatory-like domain-containing protein [Candidatus Dormibacteraeota bacterium]|nr:carboxypeptidase regulatory-like domain-containing protein [Candidatus Dormibacteraeota bacterium]